MKKKYFPTNQPKYSEISEKKQNIRVVNAPNFCQIGCFFTFLRKKVENAPKFCTFGCF